MPLLPLWFATIFRHWILIVIVFFSRCILWKFSTLFVEDFVFICSCHDVICICKMWRWQVQIFFIFRPFRCGGCFFVWIWRIIIGIQYCCWRMTKIGKWKSPLLQYGGIWAYLLCTCLEYCLGKFCGKWPYGVSNRYCLRSILLLMVNG